MPHEFITFVKARPGLKSFIVDFFKGKDWYIWGIGTCGSKLIEILNEENITILGCIDRDSQKASQGLKIKKNGEGIKIINFDKIMQDSGNIFISIADIEATLSIKSLIHTTFPNFPVYDFTDLAYEITPPILSKQQTK